MITARLLITGCLLLGVAQVAAADCAVTDTHCRAQYFDFDRDDRTPTRGLGVRRYRLDGKVILTGWQLSDRWYLGHERHAASDFGLVRRGERSEFALGNKGIEVTLKF